MLPLLAPPEGAALVRLIEGFLGDAQNFAYTSSLLYADSPEHVLYDADARRIVGIIDWGDLATGDPDFDLLYLRQDYGEAFVARLLDHYAHPDPARLFEKLRVFDACDQINTIVERGSVADEDSVYEATAALRAILTGIREHRQRGVAPEAGSRGHPARSRRTRRGARMGGGSLVVPLGDP